MPRHKLKPNFDPKATMQEMIAAVAAYYGEPYDDRYDDIRNRKSLRATAEHFNITVLKVRKMLITAEMYSIAQSRQVQKLYSEGKTVPEIMEILKLSRASVQSYLPYSKTVYNLDERSVGADRIARWREKHKKTSES
jgi:hypothetical protein